MCKRKELLKKATVAAAAIVTSMALLAGCAGKTAPAENTDTTESAADGSTTEGESQASGDNAEAAPLPEAELTMPESAVSSNVWEVAGKTFFIGAARIISYDEATGKTEELWVNKNKDSYSSDSTMYDFSDNRGLILKDRIYYTEVENIQKDGEWSQNLRVCSMALDGSQKRELHTETGLSNTYGRDMAYADGILYVYYVNTEAPICLKLTDDGEVTEQVDCDSLEPYKYVEAGSYVPTQLNNGCTLVFPAITYKELGKVITVKDYSDIEITDVATGNTTEYSEQYVVAMSGSKLLLYHYNSTANRYEYSVLDVATEEYNKIYNDDYTLYVFAMDDKYAYLYGEMINLPTEDTKYYKFDLSNGEISELYTVDGEDSALPGNSTSVVTAAYRDGKLYTDLNRGYAYSVARIDTATKDETVLVDKFYDSGIGEIGKLVGNKKESKYDGKTMATASATVIQLDGRFAGASKINEDMKGIMNTVLSFVDDTKEECIEWYNESSGDYFMPYSCESNFRYVSYNDGKLINIMQEGYDYYGGAHGMPTWNSMVYDLETGESKNFGDLFDITEEELNELAVKYITEHMNEIGEYYWDGYEDTVRDYTNLNDAAFYLTDDGVVLYYAPYALASYAAGFQEATIPYSELKPNFR